MMRPVNGLQNDDDAGGRRPPGRRGPGPVPSEDSGIRSDSPGSPNRNFAMGGPAGGGTQWLNAGQVTRDRMCRRLPGL
eukprot:52361-Hanusia_phi.AAC.1